MKLHELTEIPGVKDLTTLLEFLGDQDRFAERLQKLNKARDEINELVAIHTEGKDIRRARQSADARLQAAAEAETKLRRDSSAFIRESKESADALVKAREELDEIRAELTKREKNAADRERRLERAKAQLESDRADFRQSVESEKNAVKRLREDYEKRLAEIQRFKQAI